MSTLRKIYAISWKDAIIRFASKSELLFFLVLPLVFTFLLAGGAPSGDADGRVRLVLVNQADSALAGSLIAELEKSQAVRLDPLTLAEAEAQFDERQVSAMLVIPADFTLEALKSGEVALDLRQQPNSMNAQIAQRAVQAAASRVGSAVQIAEGAVSEAERIQPFASEADRQAYFEAALAEAQTLMQEAPVRLEVVRASTEDPVDWDPAANSSAGQLITWVFIPLVGISAMFAYERQQGTLRRLLTTPTARATYLFGTITGQVLVAFVQMALLVGFGILVMRLNWGREPLALAVLLIAFALAAAALGTTLGTFIKTENQASGLSIMIGMVFALLGGCWYPLELFPQFVQSAVRVLPTTWAMQGMLDLVLRGAALPEILPEAGVLLGFALVFFAVGVWRFKFE